MFASSRNDRRFDQLTLLEKPVNGTVPPSQAYGDNTTISEERNVRSIMGALLKVEKGIDLLMSLATIVGFISTAYLVWIFIQTPPSVAFGTENVGAGGISLATENTVVIQGIPFFWVLTSLVSLSAGHVYRSAKHLVLELAGKHYFPHAPHLMKAVQPTATPTAPRIRQTDTNQ